MTSRQGGPEISADTAPGTGSGSTPAGESGASSARAVSSIQAIRSVLRVRAFRRLWYSTALSSLGDWLGLLATTALAASLATGYQAQSYALGGVLVVRLLPAVLLGPLAGAFADRFDRRATMVISDAIRFGLFLTIPLAHLVVSSDRTLAWLYIASFLIECVSLFWMPAKDAAVPNLVRTDQLEYANQLSLITTYGFTPVLGAALFSLLSLITNVLARHLSFFQANPVNLALYFDAATFLVGALVVVLIPEISGRRQSRPVGEQATVRSLIREGANFIRSSPLVGGLIIGLIGAFAAGGAVIGSGHTFVSSLGGGNASYGVLFGCVFVGLGAGIALGPRVARELSRRRLFGLSIVFGGVCLALTGLMPQVALAMIFVLGVGFGAGLAYLSGVTLLGSEVDDQMRGRVFALLQSLIRVVLILSLAVVNFIVAQVGRNRVSIGSRQFTIDGTRYVLVAFGLVAVILGLFAYRKLDDKHHVPVWIDVKMSLRGDTTTRRRLSSGGVLIAFEGGEGSGKSTQINRLAEALRAENIDVVVTREPGATPLGQSIRQLLLHTDTAIAPRAEALLFAADRADHVARVIKPALDLGEVVLTDRFVDSSLAYQGAGRDLTMDEVRRVSRWATAGVSADLTVLLDIPAVDGLARAKGRSAADRLEQESIEFHERVRAAYRSLAESAPRRYLVLDARESPDVLAIQVRAAVDLLLSGRRVTHRLARARGIT